MPVTVVKPGFVRNGREAKARGVSPSHGREILLFYIFNIHVYDWNGIAIIRGYRLCEVAYTMH